MNDAYILAYARTPIGRHAGALAGVRTDDLAAHALRACLERVPGLDPRELGEVVMGCVNQAGEDNRNVARQAALLAGVPVHVPAVTVNRLCGSGLDAVGYASRLVAGGECELALAGGVESMSQAPFEADAAPFYRDLALAAHFEYVPPPIVADWLATQERLTRDELDAVTVQSHQRAGRAWAEGRYANSVVPVVRPDGTPVDRDETVRPALTATDLGRFGPAFAQLGAMGPDAFVLKSAPALGRVEHLHCVAHCPPIADGAALALLGTRERGRELGLPPRARIAAFAELNADPLQPFEAGFVAFERVLGRAGIAAQALGAIEFMEAFAAVPARFLKKYPELAERTNESGGHLAMGHPMGASGAVLVATLLAEMERKDVEWGVAVAHAVSGVGCAVVLQRS